MISKKRYPTLLQAPESLLGEMLTLARRVAEEQGLTCEGFRLVINTHPQGGQRSTISISTSWVAGKCSGRPGEWRRSSLYTSLWRRTR